MGETLFDDAFVGREACEIASGAVHVPDFLSVDEQRFLLQSCDDWAAGPVPPRAARIGEHLMSVRTVCLGWHWTQHGYSREATDVNGRQVLPVPPWLVTLGRLALGASGQTAAASTFTPDAVLVNFYGATAQMGMHQDRDELSLAPVVSLSIGDRCRFRLGNSVHRGRPYTDIELASGDLFVFGGASRRAFHGVTRVFPGTAPAALRPFTGRINLTLRETGLGAA